MSEEKKQIVTGNAITEGQNGNRGWFIGSFIESNNTLQTNKDIEVKWGIHPKGEERVSKVPNENSKTISILIKRKYGLNFENTTEVILEKEGDYLIFSPNLEHTSIAYEDSIIITIRWPSLSAEKN